MPGPALFAYDGSPPARHALEDGGRRLAPGPALVVCVWETVATLSVRLLVPLSAGGGEEVVDPLDAETRAAAQRTAQEGAELLAERGWGDAEPLALRVHADPGRHDETTVWHALLALAEERDAAVLVLGSRGRGAAGAALLGSVTHGVVNRGTRPVLVVPLA